MEIAFVLDRNASFGQTRTHEIITRMGPNNQVMETKQYKLSSEQECEMPLEHAMKFLVDEAFVVLDKDGERILPITKNENAVPGIQLANDEVVANLDELTKEALMKRALVLPGSEAIKPAFTKDNLIEFIVKRSELSHGVGKSRGSEGVIGELPMNELESLLDGG